MALVFRLLAIPRLATYLYSSFFTMPTRGHSRIQATSLAQMKLKEHKKWILALRQESGMPPVKIVTLLEKEMGVTVR
jgi:hypothetical protein